jgi:hypothetical protein
MVEPRRELEVYVFGAGGGHGIGSADVRIEGEPCENQGGGAYRCPVDEVRPYEVEAEVAGQTLVRSVEPLLVETACTEDLFGTTSFEVDLAPGMLVSYQQRCSYIESFGAFEGVSLQIQGLDDTGGLTWGVYLDDIMAAEPFDSDANGGAFDVEAFVDGTLWMGDASDPTRLLLDALPATDTLQLDTTFALQGVLAIEDQSLGEGPPLDLPDQDVRITCEAQFQRREVLP